MQQLELREHMKVELPEFADGNIAVDKFTVDAENLGLWNMRLALEGRAIPPGTYTRLLMDGSVMMSDTPAELMDHLGFALKAKGHVLVGGFGLGCLVKGLLAKPEVESVTVLELNEHVIKNIASHYKDGRLRIINADVFTWVPDQRFDYCWMDIWPTISGDDYEDHLRLKKKYGLCTENPVECWAEKQVKALTGEFQECLYSNCYNIEDPDDPDCTPFYTCGECGWEVCDECSTDCWTCKERFCESCHEDHEEECET